MAPVAFDLLGLVTGGSIVIDDFEDGFGESFRRYRPPVIELEGKQHLETPPFAAIAIRVPIVRTEVRWPRPRLGAVSLRQSTVVIQRSRRRGPTAS
jgi:hypothetical protein